MDKHYYSVGSFIAPVEPPTSEPTDGELIAVCFASEWLPYVCGALTQLTLEPTWKGDAAARTLAARRGASLIALINSPEPACSADVEPPFWDDQTDVELSEPQDAQTWYGVITDILAPADGLDFVENVAVWVFTGFIAYSGQIGAAIFFHTIAPRFILAWKRGDVGEVFRIVIDSSEAGTVDTTSASVGDMVEFPVLADPSLDAHDLYIVKMS